MSLNFYPNGMPQMNTWEEEDLLVPISSEEAESLRRIRILVRRMVAEKEIPETNFDDVFGCFH